LFLTSFLQLQAQQPKSQLKLGKTTDTKLNKYKKTININIILKFTFIKTITIIIRN